MQSDAVVVTVFKGLALVVPGLIASWLFFADPLGRVSNGADIQVEVSLEPSGVRIQIKTRWRVCGVKVTTLVHLHLHCRSLAFEEGLLPNMKQVNGWGCSQ